MMKFCSIARTSHRDLGIIKNVISSSAGGIGFFFNLMEWITTIVNGAYYKQKYSEGHINDNSQHDTIMQGRTSPILLLNISHNAQCVPQPSGKIQI